MVATNHITIILLYIYIFIPLYPIITYYYIAIYIYIYPIYDSHYMI